MQHRDKLVGFTVFKDGVRKMGIADITLPDLEYMTESMKGSGIGGEVDLVNPGNISPMSLTINWRTINEDAIELAKPEAHNLECFGAISEYNSGIGKMETRQIRVNVKVMPKKVGFGKFENNATTDTNNEFSVLYLKIKNNGSTKVEIDPLNYKFRIGDTDFLEAVRIALGLL